MQLEKKMDGLKMKWLLQQAKTALRTKINVQIKEKQQGLMEDVTTVVSMDIIICTPCLVSSFSCLSVHLYVMSCCLF